MRILLLILLMLSDQRIRTSNRPTPIPPSMKCFQVDVVSFGVTRIVFATQPYIAEQFVRDWFRDNVGSDVFLSVREVEDWHLAQFV